MIPVASLSSGSGSFGQWAHWQEADGRFQVRWGSLFSISLFQHYYRKATFLHPASPYLDSSNCSFSCPFRPLGDNSSLAKTPRGS